MFFPRLRRQAKWMFVVLALVFMVGFVGFGVGSGSTGIGDLFSNGKIFGLGGNASSSSSPSVSKAQKELARNPDAPKGYRDLSTAYQDKKQNEQAIAPLEKYTELRPKDQDALRELAGLYLALASQYQTAAQQAQLANPVAVSGQVFQLSGKLGTALGSDPIQSAMNTDVNSAVQDQVTKLQAAQRNAIGAYQRLTAAAPNDPNSWFGLAQTAESTGDYATAIAAYKRVIKLEPDSSDVPAIKQHLKQLGAVGTPTTSG
jgi:tetratricopeptide (TPR) repeat protein